MNWKIARWNKGRRRPKGSAAPLLSMGIGLLLVFMALVEQDTPAVQSGTIVAGPEISTSLGVVEVSSTTSTTLYSHPIRSPKRIVIPAIEVDAKVVPVGLQRNRDMEMPRASMVGWYELGPPPGDPGPAVMVGHVDTARRPAVFYRLGDLRPGDEIFVHGDDGDVATFVVDHLEQWLKIDLPTDRIWDYTPESVIRLITCTGEYDRRTHHYLANLIVYGYLVR